MWNNMATKNNMKDPEQHELLHANALEFMCLSFALLRRMLTTREQCAQVEAELQGMVVEIARTKNKIQKFAKRVRKLGTRCDIHERRLKMYRAALTCSIAALDAPPASLEDLQQRTESELSLAKKVNLDLQACICETRRLHRELKRLVNQFEIKRMRLDELLDELWEEEQELQSTYKLFSEVGELFVRQ